MSKRTPVPSFHLLPRALFRCIKCPAIVEICQWGTSHVSSSEHCRACGACYVVEWKLEIEESTIVLVEREETEAKRHE